MKQRSNNLRKATFGWRADRWRMETNVEEIEGEIEKGSEEPKGRGVKNKRATK